MGLHLGGLLVGGRADHHRDVARCPLHFEHLQELQPERLTTDDQVQDDQIGAIRLDLGQLAVVFRGNESAVSW